MLIVFLSSTFGAESPLVRCKRPPGPKREASPARVLVGVGSGRQQGDASQRTKIHRGRSHLAHLQRSPGMSICEPTSLLTAGQRVFAQLWSLSGAPALVGYEAYLLAVLARMDTAMYERVAVVDLEDRGAVLDAVELIQNWRRDVAAGTRSFSFGARPTKRPSVGANLSELAEPA